MGRQAQRRARERLRRLITEVYSRLGRTA